MNHPVVSRYFVFVFDLILQKFDTYSPISCGASIHRYRYNLSELYCGVGIDLYLDYMSMSMGIGISTVPLLCPVGIDVRSRMNIPLHGFVSVAMCFGILAACTFGINVCNAAYRRRMNTAATT